MTPKKSSSQQLACLYSDGSKLKFTFQDISDSINIGHVGLFYVVDWYFATPIRFWK